MHGVSLITFFICLPMQGPDTVKFLEKLLVADLAEIQIGSGSLSLWTNENGGIVDDTVLTKVSEAQLCSLLSSARSLLLRPV